jgi:hypothetical protein
MRGFVRMTVTIRNEIMGIIKLGLPKETEAKTRFELP